MRSPGEEDDAVALVRVYCGLASADERVRAASAGSALTIAVVDDAGRLLGVHEISDDPAGYAQLGTLLVERTSGFAESAVAADSDDHMVTSLLTAAGRPLVVADDDSADKFAERFADDDSPEERAAPPAARRAVGLARALQAGAIAAVTIPAPRELTSYKPVLAAHVAMLNGRHAAALALREVLRELYPAALRAYPDPSHPLALAVLDALPEPGRLTTNGNPERVAEEVAAELTRAGAGTEDQVVAALTALVVAVSESPRRGGVNKSLAPAAADTVRHAIGAVKSCDAACEALVGTLAARVSQQAAGLAPGRRQAGSRRAADPASTGIQSLQSMRAGDTGTRLRRTRPEPAAASGGPISPHPLNAPPLAPDPLNTPPLAPRPLASPPGMPAAPAASLPTRPTSSMPTRPTSGLPTRPTSSMPTRPTSSMPSRPTSGGPEGGLPTRPTSGTPSRPVSVPPPPPGMTPITPGTRPGSVPPADAGEPFRPTLTNAALNSARAERQRSVIPPRPNTRPGVSPAATGATDFSLPMPTQRAAAEPSEPGSRANWPLLNQGDDAPAAPPAEGRVKPPWQDMPKEPAALRLVDGVNGFGDPGPASADPPSLRLVEGRNGRAQARRTPTLTALDRSTTPPVAANEGDGDLLIFAAARSAWFTGHSDPSSDNVEWTSPMDSGWRAAEKAAAPEISEETPAGLPKRVPRANLVPGSPQREEQRPLRIVRDAASIAAHTTGYFRGWRRGQEIGGYAIGGRPGRESAGGWDFSRDGQPEDDVRNAGFPSR
ncbi:transposase [Symbioplanes lichenis]|uniref:transposase n=1 Tax=Symbioplanes lichenis TaxID=1629072 RepID=UPI002738DC9E|nr:transposase [Actinoplanes lichenis]